MQSLGLRARTVETDSWYNFTLKDIPTKYDDEHIALLANAGSPLLKSDLIVRGDLESGLYEGDILSVNDDKYIVCYERGFYAINENYIITNLYQLKEYKLIGDYWKDGFPILIRPRKKQLYHYNNINFKLTDIIGHWADKILIRASNKPIPPEECQQECCITHNSTKLFFGDLVNGYPVQLAGGRICIKDNEGYYDLATGGYLNDYTAGSTG